MPLIEHVPAALRDYRREILVSLAVLGGWTLLTWGVASLLVWQVWPISFGVLLLALAGFRFLGTIATRGLYVLSGADLDG